MNRLKNSLEDFDNKKQDICEHVDMILSSQNKRIKYCQHNELKKNYLQKDDKQIILGGGCGTSRVIQVESLSKIQSKKKNKEINKLFMDDYNRFIDKDEIASNIEQEYQNQLQVRIFKQCIHQHRIFIRENVQLYKNKLFDLIEVFQMYVISGASLEEGLTQQELKDLGNSILEMRDDFKIRSEKQPCIDLVFYFDILYKLTSYRESIEKNNNKLAQVASFILKIVQAGVATFKGDFGELISISADIGSNLFKAYKNSKSKQLFSHILDIHVKRVEQFKKKLWKLTIEEELEFYLNYFCDLSNSQEQQTDFVLIILIKINYYFSLISKEDFSKIRQQFPLSNDLIQKFLSKMIQRVISKDNLQDSIYMEFYAFSISNPTFRFLTISILLKYYQIISSASDFSNKKDDTILVYLIYKYLCEKNKSVQLAYETNTNFEEIYNKTIEDKEFMKQVEDMSKKRRIDFQAIFTEKMSKKNELQSTNLEDNQEIKNIKEQLNNKLKENENIQKTKEQPVNEEFSQINFDSIEEKIDSQGDLERLIANKLVEKWERDVRLRQQENIAQKDDVLIEVKDLYIQQSLTYQKGNIKLQGITPSKQSFSDIGDEISANQSQKALKTIVNHFLKSDQHDKQIRIKEEQTTNQESIESSNKLKILGILAEGGTGKSMLLKKLETDLIDNSDKSTYGDIDYIPLLIKCNSLDPAEPSLEQYLQAQGVEQRQIQTIKQSNRNKLILLDGYDEYTGDYFRVYSKLNLEAWKNTKVIVTTRREKLTLNEACFNFSLDNEKGQIDESSFCLMKLEEFNKQDILDYCKRYFQLRRINKEQAENDQQVKEDLRCIEDCMLNKQLENLLYLPINLYLFTRMMVDMENQSEMQQIKLNILDQVGIQEIFFKEQFKREALDFVQQSQNQRILEQITNCYFEYFQIVAMKMFLNKGKKGTINFLQLQKDQIHFSLRKYIQKELSKEYQSKLINKIINYVNSKIITRVKDVNTNKVQQIQSQVIEFKHKSLFEYFVARAMKYDFDVHQNNICNLSIQELKEFSINQKTIMNIGQNQSEQQILLKLYKLIKNEIESTEFQSNYHADKIENNNKYIQYLKRSTIKKSDEISQIDIGASNLLSALFISKFSFPRLRLSLCSFSKAYICNPKSNEIDFDRCNFNHANLQNSCINYDSCNTQQANFEAFSKVFDTQNIYSFNKVIWGKNNEFYSISNSGFLNQFQIVDSKIQVQNSKQLSQTPLFEILKFNEVNFLVSSKFSLLLINQKNFQIKESYKFKDSIECVTVIKESIVVILKNEIVFFGNFEDGFKELKVNGKISAYNKFSNTFVTCQNDSINIWNAEKGFELLNIIKGDNKLILSVTFSADGRYLATGSKDNTCKIWNAEKGFELINTIQGHTKPIISVAFSVDGKYLATGSKDNTCKIWNAEKGFELINTIQVLTSNINSVVFSEDGKYLATGSSDSTCKIWNAEKDFELINTIQGHTSTVHSVAFSQDVKFLATGSFDNTCKIWNTEKGFELIKTIQGHTKPIFSVVFSEDGKYLATGSKDSTCKIWNVQKDFELINTIQQDQHTIVQSVAFSADGKYFAASVDRTFKIWNVDKGFELIKTIQDHISSTFCVVFSRDGKYLASVSEYHICKIWNAQKDFELINTIKGHTSNIISVVFSADGKYLATGSLDYTCKIWNAEKGFELINTIKGHTEYVRSVAFSADGKYLATGSEDRTCKIWNAEKGFELINTISCHTSPIFSVAFSADGKYLATGSQDSTCKIWNVDKGFELINSTLGHNLYINSVAFSTDGKYLVTGSQDYTCKIWNAEKGFELINTIQGHTSTVITVTFSADGKYLATGSSDSSCKIWNAEKGFELIKTIQNNNSKWVFSVAFSADGKYFATGSTDFTKIWNVEKDFELINTIQIDETGIKSNAFSADVKYLACGSYLKLCSIFNVEKGFELINTIQCHTEPLTSVAFSTDGKYLATSSEDKTCKIWNAEKGFELIYTIQDPTFYMKSIAFSPDGKYLATGSQDNTCKIWNAQKYQEKCENEQDLQNLNRIEKMRLFENMFIF